MKRSSLLTALTIFWSVSASAAPGGAGGRWEIPLEVTTIEFEGVSGNITIAPADSGAGRIKLRTSVRPERSFRPEVERDGSTLYISEHWESSSGGSVEWLIYLPQTTKPCRLRMSTASGELECRGVHARIDFSTASGNILLSSVTLGDGSSFSTASGDVVLEEMTVDEGSEFSTASGDVVLENVTIGPSCTFSTASGDVRCTRCKGHLELSSASGNVVVRNCEPAGRSSFSTASGNVSLALDKLPAGDIKASSASGDVLLEVGDFGDSFTLVMVAREDDGRISCPFDFTEEDTYEDDQGNVYEEKIVERGAGKPEISLRTSSGDVIVKD